MNQFNFIIGGIVALLLMGVGVLSGWTAHEKFRPCPTITIDTIVIEDTHWHHIADSLAGLPPNEIVKWLPRDTLFIPGDSIPMVVDTAAILKDYFSVYKYKWEKKDDTLAINLYTTVTKNMPIKYDLSYKVLIPFTTIVNNIDNSVIHSRYFYLGGTIIFNDVKSSMLGANFATVNGLYGIHYSINEKTWSASYGIKLFTLRNK